MKILVFQSTFHIIFLLFESNKFFAIKLINKMQNLPATIARLSSFDFHSLCSSRLEPMTTAASLMNWSCSFLHPNSASRLGSCRKSVNPAVPCL